MNNAEYREFVHDLIKRGDGRTFLNSDEDHALIVLTELIDKAQKELLIFAGSLTGRVGSDPAYIIAISEFIERGGTLNILLNDFQRDSIEAKNSRLYRRLSYYQYAGSVPTLIHTEVKTQARSPYTSPLQTVMDIAWRLISKSDQRNVA